MIPPTKASGGKKSNKTRSRLPEKGQPGVTIAKKKHLVDVKVFNTENVDFEFSSRIWNQIPQSHQTHNISPWGACVIF